MRRGPRRGLLIIMALLAACATDAATNADVESESSATAAQRPTATPVDPPATVETVDADATLVDDAAVSERNEPEAEVLEEDTTMTSREEDVPTPTPIPTPTSSVDADSPDTRCVRLTDFAVDAENLSWFIVNDNVMGGRSSGGPTFADSAMVFEGEINTNGGGFSSVRVQLGLGALEGFTELHVRARTDGRAFKLILEDGLATRDRRVSQQGDLDFGASTDWATAIVQFEELEPKIFGRSVETDAFRPDLATQLGVMISDGVDGPFRIELDWIDACR